MPNKVAMRPDVPQKLLARLIEPPSLLGHARLSTAQIYTRVSVGRMMRTYNKAHPQAEVRTSVTC